MVYIVDLYMVMVLMAHFKEKFNQATNWFGLLRLPESIKKDPTPSLLSGSCRQTAGICGHSFPFVVGDTSNRERKETTLLVKIIDFATRKSFITWVLHKLKKI